jgi:predicted permease
MFTDLLFRVRALLRGREMERELDEELQSHLEHEIDKYVQAGMPRPEAVRRAHLALGGLEQTKEDCRAARGTRWIEESAQDVRYGCRLLRRSPMFTLGAVVSLSLGIGAVTAVFSILNAVWLKPLPIADPARVIRVYNNRMSNVSYADFVDLTKASTLEGLVAFAPTPFSLTVGSSPMHVMGELVSGDYFDVLGIRAAAGRTFLPAEGRPGAAPVVVVSHLCWQRLFDGDRGIVGRSVRVNGYPFVVIGVLPAGVRGMLPPLQADMWVPVTMEPVLSPESKLLESRDAGRFHLLGRLGPHVTLAQAHAELSAIARALEQRHPETNRGRTVSAYPARPLLDGFAKPVLAFTGFLLALAAGLLLTAAVNIGSLLLARAAHRRAENGLRLALGATRWRLIRQHLVESLLLAAAGAVGGTMIAVVATRALRSVQPPTPVPVGLDVGVDPTVFLASLAAGAVVTVLMGLVPAIRSSREDLVSGVREASGTTASAGGARLRTAFVVTQVALSFALVGVAGLLARSALAAGRLDLGFNQDDTWAMSVDLETRQYSPEQGRLFQRQVQEALRAVPGVLSVTAADIVPVTLSSRVIGLRRAEGSSATTPAEPPLAVHTNAISPGHFATLRIPMVSGRDFDERDADGRPLVAIVNETLAGRLWPGESAIGKHLHHGTETAAGIEVVGVVRDSKYATPGEEPKPFLYRPLAQAYTPRVTFLMRTTPGVTGVLEEGRRVIHGLDGNLAIYNADSLLRITEVSRLPARVAAGFATLLAAAALGLAGFGTFSLLAFVVSTRTREFGIRMALGAAPARLLRDVLRLGASWLVIGQLVGLGLALAAARALRGVLYGISPTDPTTLAIALAISTVCGTCASLGPALRVLRMDPVRAIRQE